MAACGPIRQGCPILFTKVNSSGWTWGHYLAWGDSLQDVDRQAKALREETSRRADNQQHGELLAVLLGENPRDRTETVARADGDEQQQAELLAVLLGENPRDRTETVARADDDEQQQAELLAVLLGNGCASSKNPKKNMYS
jgi:hypothetical protein